MTSLLKLGTSKIDITPVKKVHLAGFAHRTTVFEGVFDPIYARILCFQQKNSKGDTQLVLLVSADLIWWGPERVAELHKQIKKRWGFFSTIILHATHNHSGPQTSNLFTPSLGKFDSDYVSCLETKLFEGIENALKNMEAVEIDRGKGECRIGINRRKQVGEEIKMLPNASGPVDSEVLVVRFRTESDQTKAVLVHFACHPTTTGDNYISGEFPGIAMNLVEQALGEETVAAYLQGCCGDVRPALIKGNSFYRGSHHEVFQFGETLADEVLNILQNQMLSHPPGQLFSQQLKINLSFQALPAASVLEEKRAERGVMGEWARLLLSDPGRMQPQIPFEMTLLEIADGLSLLAMNAEMVVEYGLFLKERFAGRVLPVPYSNGMIGYVPTEKQVIEGGYEANEAAYYFGLPSSFDPSVERRIRESMIKLARRED